MSCTWLLGCQDVVAPVYGPRESVPAPDDVGERCLDVADVRACWGAVRAGPNCAGEICVVPRPLPNGAAPPSGYRCAGQGAARRCEARSNQAGPFVCDGARCVQQRPRMPDAGEWLCVEMSGVVYCRSVGAAAGIVAGTRDPAFVCGARAGAEELICIDLSPDRPPGARPLDCRFSYDSGRAERVCRAGQTVAVGDGCARTEQCPQGARCVARHCIPERPQPSCWLDSDCPAQARCRWGSCLVREQAR